MNSIDLISMGLKNLFRRKLRTFLTALGILIGTVSIVVMISLALGMKKSGEDFMKQMGSVNVIEIRPSYNNREARGRNGSNEAPSLKDKDVAIFSKIEGVEAISPLMRMQATLKSGKYEAQVDLVGILPEVMSIFDFKVDKGRLLEKSDKLSLVYGGEIPMMFQNPKAMNNYYGNPMGQGGEPKANVDVMKDKINMVFEITNASNNSNTSNMIETNENNGESAENTAVETIEPSFSEPHNKVETFKVKTVGILPKGDFMKGYSVYMPLEQLRVLKNKIDKLNNVGKNTSKSKEAKYDSVSVRVKDVKIVKKVQEDIKKLGYETSSLLDMAEDIDKQTKILELIFGGIGAISLIVAAIGITNTMVMAIYERRKEIGVMKVVGASIKDIKKLFLFESAMIGLIGGVLGLIVSLIASKIINVIAGGFMQSSMMTQEKPQISVIPIWLLLGAIAFTTLIGLISGYLPARKAMKLSALEAIKTD